MQKQIWERIAVIAFAAASLLFILGNVLFVWVATGPRPLPFLTPHLEEALNPENSPYRVTIGNTVLGWEGWSDPLDLRVERVEIISREGARFAQLPEISIGLNLVSLLVGRLEPKSLTLENADITLRQDLEGNIRLDSDSGRVDAANPPVTAPLAMFESPDSGKAGSIDRVVIRNARLKLLDMDSNLLLAVPEMSLGIRRNREGFKGEWSAIIDDKKVRALLNMHGQWRRKERTAEISAGVAHLNPRLLSLVMPSLKKLAGVDLPVTVKLSLKTTADRKIERLDFDVKTARGMVALEGQLPEPLTVNRCAAKGYLTENLRAVTLVESICDFGNPVLKAHGVVRFMEEGFEAHLVGNAKALSVDELYKYWPKSVGPETREWVVTSITGGRVPGADVTLNILPGDTALPALPAEAVRAQVEVQDTNVHYKPGHPRVENVSGLLSLSGKTMHFEAKAARMLTGTQVKSGHVHIDDLNLDNPGIALALNVAAPAGDVATFLALPDIDLAKKANLDATQISGNIEGKVTANLKMYSDRGPNADHVAVTVDARLIGVSQPDILERYDIAGLDGDFKATNDHIELRGKGTVNAVPLSFELTRKSAPKGDETLLKAWAASMPVAAFARFGFAAPKQLSGHTGVDIAYREKSAASSADLVLDLTPAAFGIEELAYRKPAGVAAQLVARIEQEEGTPVRIPAFTYNAEALSARGNALVAESGDLIAVRFDELKQGASRLTLAYGKDKDERTRLEIKGDTFDISGYMEGEENFSTEDWRNLDLRAEVGRLLFKGGRELRDVKAMLECGAVQCTHGKFSGKTVSGQPFSFTLETSRGKRHLSGKAEDAGALIRALGIYPNMEGGALSIDAAGPVGGPLQGTVTIGRHALRNAPALTKLLTIASLTGIVNTLKGSGIIFTELNAPFAFKEDVVTLDGAKSYGPALGLTADGTLDLRKGQMDVKGTVVPSYTLNSLVEKVPLIGKAITGGEGQGVFATRYSMKGPMGDPVVNLNPLSMLTPGFTRNIFNIFNRRAPKDLEEEPGKPAPGPAP